MAFHYEKQHQQLAIDCPPKSYVSLRIEAFRCVFEADDERNFKSQFEKDSEKPKPPKRYNEMSDLEKCERMALSMFDSLDNAKRQFYFLRDEQQLNEKAYLWLGTRVARAELNESDGVNETPVNKFGHFNHHPALGFDYHKRFKIIFSL